MGLFGRRRPTEDRVLGVPWVPFNINGDYASLLPGQTVTPKLALSHSAVWACVRLLSDVVASMPVHAYRSGDRAPLDPPPPILSAPAAYTTIGEWLGTVMVSTLTAGNAYGVVTARDNLERPTQIEIIDPVRVSVQHNTGGTIVIRLDGIEIARDELWWFRGLLAPGNPVGLSPIEYAATAVSLGLGAQSFGHNFFRDDSTPAGVLTSEQEINAEQAQQLASRWKATRAGRRGTAILGNGLKFEAISVKPEESQFIATQEFSVQQIARIYGVPPEMIAANSGNSQTYANVEMRDISLLKYTVGPWLVRLETALTALLPRGIYVRFSSGGLLRADTKTRYDAYSVALTAGFLTVNEVRELEDLEPLPPVIPTEAGRPPLSGVA
jgi:HK97 family phage portal protein